MSNVEQFIPDAADLGADKATLETICGLVAPDRDFKIVWATFLALKRRVESPRRRDGGDVRRARPFRISCGERGSANS